MDNLNSDKYFGHSFLSSNPGEKFRKGILAVFISLLLIFCFIGPFYAQEKINDKKAELKDLKQEINRLESELKAKQKKEKLSIDILENYNRQNHYLNQLISSIRSEEEEKGRQIEVNETRASDIEKEISRLKVVYAKYIVHLYKHGKGGELSSLFSSGSLNQALVRYKYLRKISLQRQQNIEELKQKQAELAGIQKRLVAERDEKRAIAEEKQLEEKSLDKKLAERKSILAGLRNDKNSLSRELELKKKAEGQIRNLISKLIEREEKRKAEERKKAEERRKALALRLEKEKKNKENAKNQTPTRESVTQRKEEVKEEKRLETEIPVEEDHTYSGMESFSSL
jgi:septal ring factor EnvC (AmiA/AmiB activator)